MGTIDIGDNHRRGISSTLAWLDSIICLIERLVESGGVQSVLYAETNSLSEAQKREVLNEVAALRLLLSEVHDRLGLEASSRDVGAIISGHCITLWESIIELQGKYLKRFGQPPAELVRFLDPMAERIIGHLDQIVRSIGVFEIHGPTSRSGP